MRLQEAFELSELRASNPALRESTKSGTQIANEIWSEAQERGIFGPLGGCADAQSWQKKWLPSKRFRLARIPLNAAALTCSPREHNLVLKKIHAREERPIVVDYNSAQVGAATVGYVPQVAVIDGKHRFMAAHLRGDGHILAWVGEEAAELIPALQAFGGGGGGASGGGGPSPKAMTPASGASLVAKKKSVKGQGRQEAELAQRPGTFSGKGLKIKRLDVDEIDADMEACNKDIKSGKFKFTKEMEGVHPPGCEDAVSGLARKYGKTAKTYRLAWYLHNKGRCGG